MRGAPPNLLVTKSQPLTWAWGCVMVDGNKVTAVVWTCLNNKAVVCFYLQWIKHVEQNKGWLLSGQRPRTLSHVTEVGQQPSHLSLRVFFLSLPQKVFIRYATVVLKKKRPPFINSHSNFLQEQPNCLPLRYFPSPFLRLPSHSTDLQIQNWRLELSSSRQYIA